MVFKHQPAFIGSVLGYDKLHSLSAFGIQNIADLDKSLTGLYLQQACIHLIGKGYLEGTFGTARNKRIFTP